METFFSSSIGVWIIGFIPAIPSFMINCGPQFTEFWIGWVGMCVVLLSTTLAELDIDVLNSLGDTLLLFSRWETLELSEDIDLDISRGFSVWPWTWKTYSISKPSLQLTKYKGLIGYLLWFFNFNSLCWYCRHTLWHFEWIERCLFVGFRFTRFYYFITAARQTRVRQIIFTVEVGVCCRNGLRSADFGYRGSLLSLIEF